MRQKSDVVVFNPLARREPLSSLKKRADGGNDGHQSKGKYNGGHDQVADQPKRILKVLESVAP